MVYNRHMRNYHLETVVGQERAKKMLALLTESFKRKGVISPVGIFGASGLGKTHLVTEWSKDLAAKLVYINGSAVKDPIAFRNYFKEAKQQPSEHHVVFIDECHMLPKKVQENLLSVLEDPAILCTSATKEVGNVETVDGVKWIDKGDVIREYLPKNMSFVFATTDAGKLKETMLNRLRKIELEEYTLDDKINIALMSLGKNVGDADKVIGQALANRCRNIRHLKNDLVEVYTDVHSLYSDSSLEQKLTTVDEMLGIDEDGATDKDIKYMEYLLKNKTAGVDTLAGYLKTDKLDVTNNMEPFLLEKQWIAIGKGGRKLTQAGRQKLLGDAAAPEDSIV